MIKSMTGFAKTSAFIAPWGRVNLEMRSVNHRFLDISLHLPEGLMHLEPRLKEEMARKIRRGHILCRFEINLYNHKKPVLNTRLITEYYRALQKLRRYLGLKQELDINTLAVLPGAWTMQSAPRFCVNWLKIRPLVRQALEQLIDKRQKEGQVLGRDLKARAGRLQESLNAVKQRFNMLIKQRLKQYTSEAEKNSFLKSSDISEEIVRLDFHLKSFTRCLKSKKSVGKELDFVLQEMQREANTVGAKSIDALISGRIVGLKSEIEKMREQVQNVE